MLTNLISDADGGRVRVVRMVAVRARLRGMGPDIGIANNIHRPLRPDRHGGHRADRQLPRMSECTPGEHIHPAHRKYIAYIPAGRRLLYYIYLATISYFSRFTGDDAPRSAAHETSFSIFRPRR